MSRNTKYAEEVEKKAEIALEAASKPEYKGLNEQEEHELRGLLYLTSLYGARVSEQLEEDGRDPGLEYAARTYLNPRRNSPGISSRGP